MKTSFTVSGMTCDHCVNAVETEVGRVAGVSDVHVELVGGVVTVTSDQPLEVESVRAAIDEAGYVLVG